MPFWHYHADAMTDDDSIQPLDPIRRNVHVGAKVATPKRSFRQAESGDFEASEAISAYKQQVKHQSKPKLAVRAEQIMSESVVTVEPDTSLNEVRKLVRSRRFRHVPVVTSEGHILGIVSDRDLFALPHDGDDTSEAIEPRIVADIMSKGVLTATPDTNIREIARVLFEERIGCMPIVDENGLVVGVITRSDILRALIKHAPLDLWI